jgi:hypothetical protein
MKPIDFFKKFFEGGLPMIYGIGSSLSAVGSLISMVIYLFKVINGEREFQVFLLIIMILFTAIFGFVGYLLIKVGQQELVKSHKK